MFEWNETTLRLRRDAAEYLHFDDAIAQRILEHVPAAAHMCDAGCGTGFTAAAFAEKCARVTAVDVSDAALDVLRQTAASRGLSNINTVCADVFAANPSEKYDAMTFCFFGRTRECLRAAAVQCDGRIFLVRKDWSTRRFTSPGSPLTHPNFEAVRRELDALGVRYTAVSFVLDMGQPFRSVEDAALFFKEYGGKEATAAGSSFMAKLTRTGREDFPYLLSEARPVGIITIDTGDIPPMLYE